jgi:hypothetical protein
VLETFGSVVLSTPTRPLDMGTYIEVGCVVLASRRLCRARENLSRCALRHASGIMYSWGRYSSSSLCTSLRGPREQSRLDYGAKRRRHQVIAINRPRSPLTTHATCSSLLLTTNRQRTQREHVLWAECTESSTLSLERHSAGWVLGQQKLRTHVVTVVSCYLPVTPFDVFGGRHLPYSSLYPLQ